MPDRTASVLTRAAVLMGGVHRLAQRLNVLDRDLMGWIANIATAPEEVLEKATAIVDAYEIDRTGTRLLRVGALRGRGGQRLVRIRNAAGIRILYFPDGWT